jgi:nucleoside-diphosphate-sugar epimerase
VRSKAKGDYLSKLFSGKPFSFVLVEDLADKNGFDKVMADQSFDGVLHTASPFHYRVDKPDELIEVCSAIPSWREELISVQPAVNGTTGILQSILKSGKSSVKRVVVTSSVAAINGPETKPPKTRTEADWNTQSEAAVKAKGVDAWKPHCACWVYRKMDVAYLFAFTGYCASKTMAEQAAWAFVKDNKTSFDLATVNPAFVFGQVVFLSSNDGKLMRKQTSDTRDP